MNAGQLFWPQMHAQPGETAQQRTRLLPLYKVILHDDDVNDMVYITFALMRAVGTLTLEEAERIMLTAHLNGMAVVMVCPKETAEYYQERLLSFKLTATIEPD
ncbi:MAG: ATP-dependent Clp protease adaptor ClpS [Ktedonobacteraceae bacterium]|nr:ATP-dependent Clp protease adaptor ClpS [Ktedonobacteraceae bacterium]